VKCSATRSIRKALPLCFSRIVVSIASNIRFGRLHSNAMNQNIITITLSVNFVLLIVLHSVGFCPAIHDIKDLFLFNFRLGGHKDFTEQETQPAIYFTVKK